MNPETAITETDLDRLERRESRAHDCLNTAVNSWVNFVDELNAIHKEADWKAKAPTWKAYLELEFLPKLNYGYERIYQLQAAQPFASVIERGTGLILSERQVRYIKSDLGYTDANQAVELVARTSNAVVELGLPFQPKFLASTHNVLEERTLTNGNISLEGESVPADSKVIDITQVAVLQAAIEANKAAKQKILDHSKRGKLTVQLERIQDSKGRWRLALPENVPAFLIDKQITFYIEEKAKTA
jgi:hypothetical protein